MIAVEATAREWPPKKLNEQGDGSNTYRQT